MSYAPTSTALYIAMKDTYKGILAMRAPGANAEAVSSAFAENYDTVYGARYQALEASLITKSAVFARSYFGRITDLNLSLIPADHAEDSRRIFFFSTAAN